MRRARRTGEAQPAVQADGDAGGQAPRATAIRTSFVGRDDSWNLDGVVNSFFGRRAPSASWAPPFKAAFYVLCAVRLLSSIVNTVADCDETFNYWEPLHYLMYGTGLQTWEYSPNYGLRTYFYVGLHWVLGRLAGLLVGLENKVAVFQCVRCALGIWSAFCESLLYLGAKSRFGNRTALFLLELLASSAGMFAASTAFLPSSFAMYCFAAAWGAWMHRAYPMAVFCAAAGALVGWPFCALVAAGLALDVLRRAGLAELLSWSAFSAALLVAPMAAVDRWAYGKWTLPTWNILVYNVIGRGAGRGSELYGVEPPSFYARNLALNFNIAAPLAALSIPLLIVGGSWRKDRAAFGQAALFLLPMYAWIIVMTFQPHKEERFLFPVYPLICLAAAVSLSLLHALAYYLLRIPTGADAAPAPAGGAAAAREGPRAAAARGRASGTAAPGKAGARRRLAVSTLIAAALAAAAALGAARTAATVAYYRAPMTVYRHLAEREAVAAAAAAGPDAPARPPLRVCVGKEWYRFPASFFLPPGAQLHFLRSGFRGQLPRAYGPWPNGTSADVARHFNDGNLEERSRYVPAASCHYIVDLELPGEADEWRTNATRWRPVFAAPFLHADRSPPLSRSLYLPGLPARNAYAPYVLLRNADLLPAAPAA